MTRCASGRRIDGERPPAGAILNPRIAGFARDQILGKSGGATVQLFDGAAATPSVAQLSSFKKVTNQSLKPGTVRRPGRKVKLGTA